LLAVQYVSMAAPKRALAKAPKPDPPFPKWFCGHLFSILRKHGNAIALWLGLGYIAHQVSLAFIEYAGRTSAATLSLSLMANVSFVWTASITMSGLSITLYLRERSLHRKTRERLGTRITELELKLDPTRTSSLLTSKGLTRKGDE